MLIASVVKSDIQFHRRKNSKVNTSGKNPTWFQAKNSYIMIVHFLYSEYSLKNVLKITVNVINEKRSILNKSKAGVFCGRKMGKNPLQPAYENLVLLSSPEKSRRTNFFQFFRTQVQPQAAGAFCQRK